MGPKALREVIPLILLLAVPMGVAAAKKSDDPRWSPEGRKRMVDLVRWLEAHPLGDTDRSKRQEALKWLIEAPDITVTWCSPLFVGGKNEKVRPLLRSQGTLGAAVYFIEHPGSKDERAATLAGVASALAAYRNAVAEDPSYQDPEFDSLASRQAVEAYVDGKLKECAEAEAKKK